MSPDYDHWKEFNNSDHGWSWSVVPLYYTHMLLAVAYGDAEVGFQGDIMPEGASSEDYPLTGRPIPDLWFRWTRPPEKRKFVYPEKMNDGPDDLEITELPSRTPQKENWDSPENP